MKQAKLKIGKSRIMMQGGYVTNGHWAYKVDFFNRYLKTDNAQANTLISIGNDFVLESGDVTSPSISADNLTKLMTPKAHSLNSFGIYHMDNGALRKLFRIGNDGGVIGLNAEYIDPILEALTVSVSLSADNETNAVCVECYDDPVGLIMPVKLNDIEGRLKSTLALP